jgi:1-deoxy-D-xylulose-5-phosphate synthase
MYTASLGLDLPIAIRYPRGRGRVIDWKQPFSKIEIGKGEQIKKGKSIATLTIGTIVNNVMDALESMDKNDIALYDMRFVKPLDDELLHHIFKNHHTLITVEDGVRAGGFGSAVLEFAALYNYKNNIHLLGVSDSFPEHGSVEELQELSGLSPKKITVFLNSLE